MLEHGSEQDDHDERRNDSQTIPHVASPEKTGVLTLERFRFECVHVAALPSPLVSLPQAGEGSPQDREMERRQEDRGWPFIYIQSENTLLILPFNSPLELDLTI
jgi:hypothetical protein